MLGDLNDYLESDNEGESAITGLVRWDQVENVVGRRPPEERWTHYYDNKREYKQLDYLPVSASLAAANPHPAEIMRKGMPLRADRYTEERFNGVGHARPKASDHCPVVMQLDFDT